MNPTRHSRPFILILAAAWWMGAAVDAFAQSDEAMLQSARAILQADRQEVVAETMQLSEAEAEEFWPIYHRYRAEMDTVGDGIEHLVLEYAGLYPFVPEARAKTMLKDLGKLEKRKVALRSQYLKKIGKVLPAAKTLRFAQVESRLDLAVRLELAASIPLVPIDGEIAGLLSSGASFVEGTAGGVYVQTLDLAAKVIAMDASQRLVTLMSDEGIKETVRVSSDVVNFDQIEVGDQLRLKVTEQLVVQIADPDDPDSGSAAAVVALAPVGSKPAGLAAEAVVITGTVAALDRDRHTATLEFADGTNRTFPVRADVDLDRASLGDKISFRVTEMIAIEVGKP